MKQVKVLLIEDDADDVDIYIELFESVRMPVEYLIAPDGEEAFAMLESTASLPDQIILDYLLPKADRLEFAKTVRDDLRFRNIPITVISAVSYPEQYATFSPLGIPSFKKPASFVVFKDLLESVLSGEWLDVAKATNSNQSHSPGQAFY